ncbi:MAG: TRL-like family protein [Moraxellaceae bacterium]|nr:TRL-like family protein [Moraxellaceae bacterium]
MKALPLSAIALLAIGLGGCANVRGPAPAALSHYAAPITTGPLDAAAPSKRGEACINNILGLFAMGDASIDTAKKNGNITRVVSVDHISTRVVAYYARFCTVVKGE